MSKLPIRAPQGVEIANLDDLGRFSKMAVQSGLFKDLKDAAQAAVKIQAGLELGLQPMQALSSIHLVEGKPTLGAGLLAALMQRAGYSWRIVTHTSEECRLEIRREGESLGEASFTTAEAEAAGLLRRPPWQRHRRDMLFARAISRAARWFAPAVALGVYTPDELGADEDVAEVMPAPSSRVDIIAPPPALPAPAPEPSPWGMDANETEEEAAEMVEYMTASRKKRAEMETESALATAAYDVAVEARKGDEGDSNWQRASKRLHATLRDYFWSRDAVKAALRAESVKELPASVLDAASVLLSTTEPRDLRARWEALPADAKKRVDGVKDMVKETFADTSKQTYLSAILRWVNGKFWDRFGQGIPLKLFPKNLREIEVNDLKIIDEIIVADHPMQLKQTRAYLEKAAAMGTPEAAAAAQKTLDLLGEAFAWKIDLLENRGQEDEKGRA